MSDNDVVNTPPPVGVATEEQVERFKDFNLRIVTARQVFAFAQKTAEGTLADIQRELNLLWVQIEREHDLDANTRYHVNLPTAEIRPGMAPEGDPIR